MAKSYKKKVKVATLIRTVIEPRKIRKTSGINSEILYGTVFLALN